MATQKLTAYAPWMCMLRSRRERRAYVVTGATLPVYTREPPPALLSPEALLVVQTVLVVANLLLRGSGSIDSAALMSLFARSFVKSCPPSVAAAAIFISRNPSGLTRCRALGSQRRATPSARCSTLRMPHVPKHRDLALRVRVRVRVWVRALVCWLAAVRGVVSTRLPCQWSAYCYGHRSGRLAIVARHDLVRHIRSDNVVAAYGVQR